MSQADLPNDWRTCAADLFEKHHENVLERLARQNPRIDSADLNDAFVAAILEISAQPDKFDESRGTTVEGFMVGAAQRALLPILRSHRRRRAREEKKSELVASERSAARQTVEEISNDVANTEIATLARGVAETDEERAVLGLWELGHSDAEIAQKLSKQQSEVKRIRERLTIRLRRLRERFDEGTQS